MPVRKYIIDLSTEEFDLQCGVDWQFTTDDARIKLKRLYAVIDKI
jgi:hypothetical protein